MADEYCMYLRKSRADMDAEARGEGETLERHRKALLELARHQKLNVTKEYPEVVTGETIAARPYMQQLLADVDQGKWAGVLVMEVERLARGDTIDQGIVAQAFKFSGTKIVTPVKTYDPVNEFDEEYFEFGLFMSRREYKTINRRLQAGKTASVKEGKAITNKPPYGYMRQKLEAEKGYYLVPHPDEADVVRLIYDWYVNGLDINGQHRRVGLCIIARKLNEIGIKPRHAEAWSQSTVQNILHNPAYIGKIRWNWRPQSKKMVDGKIITERPRAHGKVIVIDGMHEAIISDDFFSRAQEYISKNPPQPVGANRKVLNPLSGLVVCGKCGRIMQRLVHKQSGPVTLLCQTPSCDNPSSSLEAVERRVIDALAAWAADYKLKLGTDIEMDITSDIIFAQKALARVDGDLVDLEKQKGSLHDLLERGVYDTETYMSRSAVIAERIAAAKKEKDRLCNVISTAQAVELGRFQFVPKIEHLLQVYNEQQSPAIKNTMLKDILDKVIYTKDPSNKWHAPDAFKISIFPKVPLPDGDV